VRPSCRHYVASKFPQLFAVACAHTLTCKHADPKDRFYAGSRPADALACALNVLTNEDDELRRKASRTAQPAEQRPLSVTADR